MHTNLNNSAVPIQQITVNAYTIPTDLPESDGTLKWDSTTLIAVHATAGGITGFGYSYAPTAAVVTLLGQVRDGKLYPDLSRLGMGLELKERDATKYEV